MPAVDQPVVEVDKREVPLDHYGFGPQLPRFLFYYANKKICLYKERGII
jgi:hypothetical protein